ncbi:MAG TPA: YciI family protein [Longimicrobiales bacterium]|nr:YciI family protein [Longimicrobiales bacterium]
MRFMLLVIPAGYADATPDAMPSDDDLARMMKFNQEMADAGILLALDGLHPPAAGTRVTFSGGKPTVTDGPFAEVKEFLGGFWMIQVRSRDEAIAWASRCPMADGDVVEVRQVHEMEEFGQDAQEAMKDLDLPGAGSAP